VTAASPDIALRWTATGASGTPLNGIRGKRMSERIDFPFYDGKPIELTGRDWAIVIGAVGIAFVLLITLPLPDFPLSLFPPLLFAVLPLAALAWVARRNWTALFHHYGIKQFGQSVGFAALTIIASFAVCFVMSRYMTMAPNPTLRPP
jgi:uncharacterized protein